jgi:hypothetical protein
MDMGSTTEVVLQGAPVDSETAENVRARLRTRDL